MDNDNKLVKKHKPSTLTTKILGNAGREEMSKCMDVYTKTMNIIERTHIAMGKKSTFDYTAASPVNVKLNTNVYASTY